MVRNYCLNIYRFNATEYYYSSNERYGFIYNNELITDLLPMEETRKLNNALHTCSYTVEDGFLEHSIKVSTLSYQK